MATVGAMRAILSVNSTAFRAGMGGARTSLLSFSAASNTTTAVVLRMGMALTSVIGPFMGLYGAIRAMRVAEAFEQEMNSSLAIVDNASTAIRKRMEKTAFDVAYSTKFSMQEAAQAYYYLVSAGLDLEQSMKALPQVAAFAQAGMFDLARATELAAGAQAAMGMKLKDPAANLVQLTRVTDVLVKANKLAQASTEQFATALANDAANAGRMAGQSIEQVVAVLAAFAEKGLKGEQAGTSYARAINYLSIQAVENADAFRAAGVAMFDATDTTRTLVDVIADLEQRFAGMTDKERVAELQTLGFTKKTIALMNTLLGTSESIRGFTTELYGAGGTAQEVAGKQLPSLTAAWEKLKAVMTRWSIEKIAPVMADLGEGMSLLLDATKDMNAASENFEDAQDNFKKVDFELEGMAAWVGRAADAWDRMAMSLKIVASGAYSVQSGFAELMKIMTAGVGTEGFADYWEKVAQGASENAIRVWDEAKALGEKLPKSQMMLTEKMERDLEKHREQKAKERAAGGFGGTSDLLTTTIGETGRFMGEKVGSVTLEMPGGELLAMSKDLLTEASRKQLATIIETLEMAKAGKAMKGPADAMDIAKPLEAQMSKARSIFEQTRTPLEKFNKAMEDLQTLFDVGAFAGMGGEETYRRAVEQAQKAYEKASGTAEPPQAPALARMGSQEMYDLVRQNRMGTSKEQPIVKGLNDIREVADRHAATAQDILGEMREMNDAIGGGEELTW